MQSWLSSASTYMKQDFLRSILRDASSFKDSISPGQDGLDSGDTTPTAHQENHQPATKLPKLSSQNLTGATVRDVSVDVIISPARSGSRCAPWTNSKYPLNENALQASMIVSVWNIEDTDYFTLTFTSAQALNTKRSARPSSRIVTKTTNILNPTKSHSSTSSNSSGQRSGPTSKSATPTFQTPEFPPRGPPLKAKNDLLMSASIFQKASQMKDAILNSINMPSYGP